MKTTVNFSEFRDSFQEIRPDNFSYEGLKHLFSWLEQYEEDTGEEMELDVIAICCDFSEDYFQNIADQYGLDLSKYETDEEKQEAVADYLSDQGVYVGEAGECIIYRNF
jgi:predicted ArsR family transcriptional regulator